MVDSVPRVPRVPLVQFCWDTLEDMNTCALLCFKQQKVEATIIQSRWEWWNKRGNKIKPHYPHGTTLEPHDGQFYTQFVGISLPFLAINPGLGPSRLNLARTWEKLWREGKSMQIPESMDRFEGKSWFFLWNTGGSCKFSIDWESVKCETMLDYTPFAPGLVDKYN